MAVDRYLLPDEEPLVVVRRHYAVLTRPAIEVVGAVTVAFLVGERMPQGSVLPSLLWVAVIAVLSRALWLVAVWNVDRFVITDQRVMLVTGLTTRRVAMLPLRKVTDMTYERSPTGRMLGYGDFVMESAGENQALKRVRYLPSPDALYLEISQLMFGAERADPLAVEEY